MSQAISRRALLKGALGAGAAVAGFDPIERRWVTEAEAGGCRTFADAPRLAGTLLLDAASLAADARDEGGARHTLRATTGEGCHARGGAPRRHPPPRTRRPEARRDPRGR